MIKFGFYLFDNFTTENLKLYPPQINSEQQNCNICHEGVLELMVSKSKVIYNAY